MIKRRMLLAAMGFAGCRRSSESPPPLPDALAGNWRREELRELPAASAPDPPARNTVRRVHEAIYAGPGNVRVTLYDLSSSAAALDAVQRFRPAADTVFFYKDNYFAVVHWTGADRKALGEFVRALEKHVAAAK